MPLHSVGSCNAHTSKQGEHAHHQKPRADLGQRRRDRHRRRGCRRRRAGRTGRAGRCRRRSRRIGTYATGLTGGTSAETSALAGGRLYVTNSTGNSLDIVDVARPRRAPPSCGGSTSAPGAPAPTASTSAGGLVAVAVEASPKTAPGRVVFLRRDGSFVADVAVGALPDMLTFDDDGRQVIVANEGEPSGYGTGRRRRPRGQRLDRLHDRTSRRRPRRCARSGFAAFDAGGAPPRRAARRASG